MVNRIAVMGALGDGWTGLLAVLGGSRVKTWWNQPVILMMGVPAMV